MTTANYYKQAELALAAYGNLTVGMPDIQVLKSKDVGMASAQADKFAETYTSTKGVSIAFFLESPCHVGHALN